MHKKFKRQNIRVVCKLSYLIIWIKYSFKNLYNLWIGLLFQDLFHCTVASHFSMTYNEQTRWCTFGYAFFSNQFKIINSDHSLFLFSLVSKSKYEINNRTHRETDPWSLPYITSQYTLDSSYLWSNRAFLMNDVSNLNSYDLIQLRFCEEVWTHRIDCSVIAN